MKSIIFYGIVATLFSMPSFALAEGYSIMICYPEAGDYSYLLESEEVDTFSRVYIRTQDPPDYFLGKSYLERGTKVSTEASGRVTFTASETADGEEAPYRHFILTPSQGSYDYQGAIFDSQMQVLDKVECESVGTRFMQFLHIKGVKLR